MDYIGTETPPGQKNSTPLEDLAARWQISPRTGEISQVEAYWQALRGDALVPYRSQIDPRGIESALSHAFVAERIAEGHARIRVAGSHLSDLMGMEVRGMPLSAMFEPVARGALQSNLRALFDDPAIGRFDLVSAGGFGKPQIVAQLALFPLCDDEGEITRALGCLSTTGAIGRAPRRFSIQRSQREALGPAPASAPQATPIRGFADPQKSFAETGVPYLRLVSDNS